MAKDDSSTSQQCSPTPPAELQIRFNFSCKMCASVLEADSRQSGSTGKCPTCGAVFVIPGVDTRTGLASGLGDPGLDPDDPTPVHAYAAAGDRAPKLVRQGSGEYGIVCPRCDNCVDIRADHCPICGYPFTMEGAQRAAQTAPDGFAISAFLVGIIALPLAWCTDLGGVLAFGAVVLGWISLDRVISSTKVRRARGVAICGVVLGALGLAVLVVKQLL